MKNAILKIILVTVGALLFNSIFWQEKMGLNTIFFQLYILCSLFYLYPTSLKSRLIKWLIVANLISLFAVICLNTILSKIAFSVSLLLIISFSQYYHRSVLYAICSSSTNYLCMIHSFIGNIVMIKKGKMNFYNFQKALRFIVIPVLLVAIFFMLYNYSNDIFKDLIHSVVAIFEKIFDQLFSWFSWSRFAFLLLGLFITGGLLLKSNIDYFSKIESNKLNDLVRKKNNLIKWKQSSWFALLSLLMGRFANGMLALRNENITGIVSLLLLNLLLFIINCIDINFVWLGHNNYSIINLSKYVHEGTDLLIFSILLAMGLLLFFFRGNLNFYKNNKWLHRSAYVWIFQNTILVISVLIRDYYYIAHMGLAYKRIGVLFFLLFVLVGLITIFIKINHRKTTYYLLSTNAWFAVIVLILSACFNWDEIIANYNLSKKDIIKLDVNFLLSLSDKTLPIIEKNIVFLDKIETPNIEKEHGYFNSDKYMPNQILASRKKDFLMNQQQYSWLSWNMSDAYLKQQFGQSTTIPNIK